MTTLTPTPSVDERLDRLSAQIDYLVDRAREADRRRESFSDLTTDLAPVARQAMESAGKRLEAAEVTTEDLGELLTTLAAALPSLQTMLGQLISLTELAGDASELAGPAFQAATDRLAELEGKGYFDFMRSGAGVVDRIVTTYTEEDVEALGDNIVLILDTVKEMTQPEVMTMLRRTFHSVGDTEPGEQPPSTFALLRQMRDPQVRRGLSRLLMMLRSVGEDTDVPTRQINETSREN